VSLKAACRLVQKIAETANPEQMFVIYRRATCDLVPAN